MFTECSIFGRELISNFNFACSSFGWRFLMHNKDIIEEANKTTRKFHVYRKMSWNKDKMLLSFNLSRLLLKGLWYFLCVRGVGKYEGDSGGPFIMSHFSPFSCLWENERLKVKTYTLLLNFWVILSFAVESENCFYCSWEEDKSACSLIVKENLSVPINSF